MAKYKYEDVYDYFLEYNCELLTKKEEYKNVLSEIEFKCSCTKNDKTTFRCFMLSKNKVCNKCRNKISSERNKISIENVIKEFLDVGCILLSTKYEGNNIPLEFLCSCGRTDKKSLIQIREIPTCKQCVWERIGEERRKSFKEVNNIFEDNGCVLLSKVYKSCKDELEYLCKRGHSAKTTLDGFMYGSGNIGSCRTCAIEDISGENNYNWNGGQVENIRFRKTFEFKTWRINVFKRDEFTCRCCLQKNKTLNAHHLDGYNWCIDKRIDVDNGITLCEECHNKFHDLYGRGNNTIEQFERYLSFEMSCATDASQCLIVVRKDGKVIPIKLELQVA